MGKMFDVEGYDKDGGVSETLCQSEDLERAEEIAKALLYYHVHVQELCRQDNDEPFDWFQATYRGRVCRTFTAEKPDGF